MFRIPRPTHGPIVAAGFGLLAAATLAEAMPQASPEALSRMRDEGRLEHFIEMSEAHQQAHEWAPSPLRDGLAAAIEDSVHSLVFLVEFPDQEANEEAHTPAHFEEMLFSEGSYGTGSGWDYYTENSYGIFQFKGDVTAVWYMAPHNMAGYYCNADGVPGTFDDYGMGGGPMSVAGLIADMVELTDDEIDYSIYDVDQDGEVESFFLVHAGPGAEATGNPDHIWSHRSSVNVQTDDGVKVRDYTTEPEGQGIGVFVHEFGHVLGLPDLYDTDYSSSGNGDWTVMASGSWTGGGTRPVHYDAWSKVTLGWVEPIVIEQNDVIHNPFEVPRVEDHPVIYKLPVKLMPNWEYFLVENRQKVLFDEHLPGEGLMIWHIDDARNSNKNEGKDPINGSPHYLVTVEEADCVDNQWVYWQSDGVPGSFELELSDGVSGDRGDPFPGSSDNHDFHYSTWPNSRSYNGGDADSECAVLEISDSGDTMSVVLDVARSIPVLEMVSSTSDDAVGGDGDGRGEAGESFDLILELSSVWGDAPDVSAVLSTESSDVTILDPNGSFGDLDGGTQGDNAADPFTVQVGAIDEAVLIEFELEISSSPMGFPYVSHTDFELVVGWPEVLLVDDDGDDETEVVLRQALRDGGFVAFDEWSVADTSGTVADPFDTGNSTILWATGEENSETITASDQAALTTLIGGGVNFILTGQNYDEDLAGTAFFSDVLHVEALSENTHAPVMSGVAGHEIFDLFVDHPLLAVQTSPSSLTPLDTALPAMIYQPGDATAAVTYDGQPGTGAHKVTTFGFDLSLGQDAVLVSDILRSVIDWAPYRGLREGGAPAPPRRAVLEPNAPNPFNPSTIIAFELVETSAAALRIYELRGACVRTLHEGSLPAGRHALRWDGRGKAGEELASGVYLYRLELADETATRKMVLLK